MSEKFSNNLPQQFTKNTLDVCGEIGKKWLTDLPQTIQNLSENWSLTVKKPFLNLSYNFVAPCICNDKSEAVLKIALPLDNTEIFNEAEFLRISDGKGTVKLLNSDENRRAILLEKLNPGKHLKEIFSREEAKTVEIAISVIRRILKQPPENSAFRQLEEWFNNFFEKASKTNFPVEVLNKAHSFFE